MIRAQWLLVLFFLALSTAARADFDWTAALAGEHRSEANRARDAHRHPQETLSFFGLETGMTVLEVSPGGGWYTEVLAPLMRGNGTLIAAHASPNGGDYARRSLGGFIKKLDQLGVSYQRRDFASAETRFTQLEVTDPVGNGVELNFAGEEDL